MRLPALALALIAFASAPQALAQSNVVDGVVPAGQPTILSSHVLTSQSGCSAAAMPRMYASRRPRNAKISFRRQRVPLDDIKASCAGKTAMGIVVVYTPNPGFRGEDVFTISPRNSRNPSQVIVGNRARTFSLTVR